MREENQVLRTDILGKIENKNKMEIRCLTRNEKYRTECRRGEGKGGME